MYKAIFNAYKLSIIAFLEEENEANSRTIFTFFWEIDKIALQYPKTMHFCLNPKNLPAILWNLLFSSFRNIWR